MDRVIVRCWVDIVFRCLSQAAWTSNWQSNIVNEGLGVSKSGYQNCEMVDNVLLWVSQWLTDMWYCRCHSCYQMCDNMVLTVSSGWIDWLRKRESQSCGEYQMG